MWTCNAYCDKPLETNPKSRITITSAGHDIHMKSNKLDSSRMLFTVWPLMLLLMIRMRIR